MQEDFNEARVYARKRASPGDQASGRSGAPADVGEPEARLAIVTFGLRPFSTPGSSEAHVETIAWITGRVGVFFGHAPNVTIERDGSAQLVLDAGPFPLRPELEAFATALCLEAAHIGMDCSCSASARDGSRLRMVEGELVALDD